jgi:hypothetical protein
MNLEGEPAMPFPPVPDASAPPLLWAQYYAALGWPVIPMHTPTAEGCSCHKGAACGHPGKHPRTAHGRKDASTNRQTITEWWTQWPDTNMAIRTDGLFVLDIDHRHDGHTHLRTLEHQHGQLPDCPRVISGSGSDHYYFALPADGVAVHSSNGVIAPGVDIKCFNENINVPPSRHRSGQFYVWDPLFALDAFDLVPPPPWLVALARQARPVASSSYQPGVVIPDGARYHYLISLAGRLRASGLTEDQIYGALEIANQNCQPPEDEKELRKYAKWAGGKEMADSYTLTPASMDVKEAPNGDPPGDDAPTSWGTPFDFRPAIVARDLVKSMLVPPRFLIDRLVPDGLTVLAAPAKSYKSYFSLSLALATVGEGDWCDTFPVESTGPVVFFGLEAPLMQLRNRLHQLCPGYPHDTSPHDIIFFSGMQALPPFRLGLQQALEQVIDHYQPRLIVIDPLSYLYRLGRQDDLASATLDLLWPLAEMAAKAQVALFAPEHMRKRSKDDVSVVDQLAGSHIKAAVVHGLLMVHREGEDIIMETTMRDAPSQELAFTLTFDEQAHRVTWGYKGANATIGASRVESLRLKTLEELKSKGYPIKVPQIIENLQLPNTEATKNHLYQILHQAAKRGEVTDSKRGEWYWIGPR